MLSIESKTEGNPIHAMHKISELSRELRGRMEFQNSAELLMKKGGIDAFSLPERTPISINTRFEFSS